MMNRKLSDVTKYIIVTILAIFCVCSKVNALRSIDMGDPNDTVTEPVGSGTVAGNNTHLNGDSCKLFSVTYSQNLSKTKGINGKMVGPYIDNQGNIMYDVHGADVGCSPSYVAFCLDPNFDGVLKGQTLMYKAEQIKPESEFGRRIYALYKIYQSGAYGAGTERGYFTYEVAARILALKEGSDYQSRSNTAKARFNSHLGPYLAGSVGGDNDGAALANEAMARSAEADVTGALSSTLGLSMYQVGGAEYNGSKYGILINVNVENCQSEDCVSEGAITFEGASPTYQSSSFSGTTKTFSYVLDMGGDCVTKNITAKLATPGGDVRGAMQISPIDATMDDRQNFVVFDTGGGGGEVRASLIISNCGGDDDCNNPSSPNYPCPEPVPDECKPSEDLKCINKDENFVEVNEGDSGGGTNWESCIIGKKDVRGNSYDVVNTSKLYREGKQDAVVNPDEADRTDAILGYTSDESGGGTKTGDAHSIDDSDFCVISCKEKYAFILPGNKQKVKQGTYFSFQVNHDWEKHAVVGVSAERACVSGTIKKETFNNRVKDLRKQQIDFYNMYLFYKQLFNAMDSAEATNAYKDTKEPPKCEPDPADVSKGTRYKEEIEKTCSDILPLDKFRDNWWVPTWNGGNITFEFQWYSLPSGGNDLNSTELVKEHPVTVKLGETFEEVAKKYNMLQIDKKNFNFYNDKYSDYSSAWSTRMTVQRYADHVEEQFDESKYVKDAWYNVREIDQTCMEAGNKSEEECAVYKDYEEHLDWRYRMTFLEGSREHQADWENRHLDPTTGNFVYKEYFETMKKIRNAYIRAQQKYNALNAQIGIQSDAMQECTNYLDNFSKEQNPYRFDPVITFSYPDQSTYMKMLAPNKLENMNEGTPQVNYEKFFCNEGLCLGKSDAAEEEKTFGFGHLYDDTGDQFIENADKAKDNIPVYTHDTTKYYNVGSVGSRSTYGRFTAEGASGCSSSFNNGKTGDRNSYCYEFYQSAKQFYTQAPDGIITTSPSGKNKTILSTDGRVYPVAITTPAGEYPFYVKFANIGQFTESSSLGRIMGGASGKKGTMSGNYGATQVCKYEVCRVDDKTCGEPFCYNKTEKKWHYKAECKKEWDDDKCREELCPGTPDDDDDCNDPTSPKYPCPGKCAEIVEKQCNKGAVGSPDQLNDKDYEEKCLWKLMQETRKTGGENCCKYIDEFSEKRTGKWAKVIPVRIWNDYNKYCNESQTCKSFTIVSSDYNGVESNLSDISGVYNNGALQVNARAVSLNNVFPNGEKGFNWETSDAHDAMIEIENIGEGIFEGTGKYGSETPYLDYKIIIDSKCADAIRKYNQTQDKGGDGYGNGGFNDYTNNITNAHKEDDVTTSILNSTDRYGTTAEMDSAFRKLIEDNCSFEGKAAPDLIVDSSSLVLEPWNK